MKFWAENHICDDLSALRDFRSKWIWFLEIVLEFSFFRDFDVSQFTYTFEEWGKRNTQKIKYQVVPWIIFEILWIPGSSMVFVDYFLWSETIWFCLKENDNLKIDVWEGHVSKIAFFLCVTVFLTPLFSGLFQRLLPSKSFATSLINPRNIS